MRRRAAHHILSNLNLPRSAMIADVHDNGETVDIADIGTVQHHACTARATFLILRSAKRQVENLCRHRVEIDAPILATKCKVIV